MSYSPHVLQSYGHNGKTTNFLGLSFPLIPDETEVKNYNYFMRKENLKGLEFIIDKISSKANKVIGDAIDKAERKYWKPYDGQNPKYKGYSISLQEGTPSEYEIERKIPGGSFENMISKIAINQLKRHKKDFLILIYEEDNLTIEESENLYKELVNSGSFYDMLFKLYKKKIISKEDAYLLNDKLIWYP